MTSIIYPYIFAGKSLENYGYRIEITGKLAEQKRKNEKKYPYVKIKRFFFLKV